MNRLTLATAAGLPLLALIFHVIAGTVGLAAGSIAIVARKGGRWHRRSGVVFVYAMLAMGLAAVGISLYEGKQSVSGGAVAAYLVFTAWTTVRPLPGMVRRTDIALMMLAFVLALGGLAQAFRAFGTPGATIDGVPAPMAVFMSTIVLLAAIGDARMIRGGALKGPSRLSRHLWRMCFGLFIATGSFVAQLVRMTFMPHWTRSMPVILLLAAGPLVVMVYWMWRVRRNRGLYPARDASRRPTFAARLAGSRAAGS
jgi:uncharacterized membrane protein